MSSSLGTSAIRLASAFREIADQNKTSTRRSELLNVKMLRLFYGNDKFGVLCANRVMWLCNELEMELELNQVAPEEGASNRGIPPVLLDGEAKLIDTGPIMMHLADRAPHKELSPPLCTKERSLYTTCTCFALTHRIATSRTTTSTRSAASQTLSVRAFRVSFCFRVLLLLRGR
jgi:hypothetical protein